MVRKEGIGIGKAIGVVIVVIVVVGAAAFAAYQYYRSGQQMIFPSFGKANATVPSSMEGILSAAANGQLFPALANFTANALANNSRLTVVYNGSVSGTIGNGSTSFLSYFESPLMMRVEKYGGMVRLDINVTSIPLFGPVDIEYLNNTNGTYVCSDFNSTALANSDYKNLVVGGRGEKCTRGSRLAGIDLASIAALNFSQVGKLGSTSYRTAYQSTYKGVNCTYIAGGIFSGSGEYGAYQMCVSDVTGIPLSISADLHGQVDVLLTMNETLIQNSSDLSYINTMP
ncbi:MAG: hypothetical protein KGH98_00405 [Candidatus Micrarchaeota archaeon]|nr:hypothetical protein [Candidatus Micrarchaeota archaeon]